MAVLLAAEPEGPVERGTISGSGPGVGLLTSTAEKVVVVVEVEEVVL